MRLAMLRSSSDCTEETAESPAGGASAGNARTLCANTTLAEEAPESGSVSSAERNAKAAGNFTSCD